MKTLDVAQAYDSIAKNYDSLLEEDKVIRLALWKHYRSCFEPGQRVLDVACGTGIDTLFLAREKIYVTGIDASPGMIAQLQQKLAAEKMAHYVKSDILDISDLMGWSSPPFDGIVSAFAGLNTIHDLDKFAAAAAGLLIPEGRMIIHMLNRCSLWKYMKCIGRFQWTEAHQLRKQCEHTFVIGGQPVKHWLYTPYESYRSFFEPYFELRQLYGLGVFQPPLPDTWVPTGMDMWCNKYRPFCNWGRFYVLELQKRD